MASAYYYVRNGERVGPISGRQLKELAATGQLTPDDLVWKEGMAGWEPARKLKGLFASASASEPPPVPTAGPPLVSGPSTPASGPELFEIDDLEPAAVPPQRTRLPGRLGALQPIVDRYSRQFDIAPDAVISAFAGVAGLVLLLIASFLT